MVKLISFKDFEIILDEIEKEIRHLDKLKEVVVKTDNFYLNYLEKLTTKDTIFYIDKILSYFENSLKNEKGDKSESDNK